MNKIELKLRELEPNLFGKLNETREEVKLLLSRYINNFPQYTDHSIEHTTEVFNIVDEILTTDELNNLNSDEIYILSMACYLHDVGMCIPEERIKHISDTEDLIRERELHPDIKTEDYLRNIHHTLSAKFIREEWISLKIPTERYADAIALISEGHRVVDLGNPEIYKPKFFVKNGRDFVCLPYLSALLRIADELDITNIRTPKLLTKYYMPDNEKSVSEWNKHIVNTLRNTSENYVRFEVECSNYSVLASLEDQFTKIKNVLNNCQKVIRNISNTENRTFTLKLEKVIEEYKYINFDPKGIRYSFDVDNVINAFVGENLYNDKLTSLREVIQNSIDTCRYKKVLNPDFEPKINIIIEKDYIKIEDNGLGMDEFVIRNFFGKLGSSFYEQENVRKEYEAIGQFGVGVFSYFLMADYIDIETKTEKSETLHFRLDKDPKNYFHFFKNFSRHEAGTSITLYLKKEFENHTSNDFVEYIRDKFRFIEFTLNIQNIDIINSQSFEFNNLKAEINDNFKHSRKEKLKEIDFLTFKIENDNYECSVAYLYFKDFSFRDIFYSFNENSLFKDSNHDSSRIEVSQKGVFVTNYRDSLIDNAICKINLKKKIVDIQISRNSFSKTQALENIFTDINTQILKQIFTVINEQVENVNLPVISHNFISEHRLRFLDIKDTIATYIHLKFYHKGILNVVSLVDFLNIQVESFAISLNDDQTKDLFAIDVVDIVELYHSEDEYDTSLESYIYLFDRHNYVEKVIFNGTFYYSELISKSISQIPAPHIWEDYTFVETNFDLINGNQFYLNRSDNNYYYYGNPKFNFNHSFIKELYLLINDKEIIFKTKLLVKELLDCLTSFHSIEDDIISHVKQTNILVNELSKHLPINYIFTEKDFIEI